jgi:superfamily II DNA or RNA helicase
MAEANRFSIGDAVTRVANPAAVGTVIHGPERRVGENWYRVRFGARPEAIREDDLQPHVEAATIDDLIRVGQYGLNETISRRLTLAKIREPLREAIYSLDSSRTDFHAYQFKPLFKFLASERNRLLIADEVGLGKTIEAGYILRELRARSEINRVLIVCPAALRVKWQVELANRFGEQFDLFNAEQLRGWLGQDNGQRALRGIVSMQTLRTEGLLDRLEEHAPRLDLLIVDEAHHHRNQETAQHRAVRQLCNTSESIVFLTATPLHLGNVDLFNLLRLLLPEEFQSLNVFEQRLQANQHIVRAETLLRSRSQGSVQAARHSLLQARTAQGPFNFAGNPIYKRLLATLEHLDEGDVAGVVQAQSELSHINLLSHVLTRTKKRDTGLPVPKRVPHIVPVRFAPEERTAYDRIYDFCAEHYTKAAGRWAAQFPLIALQRQMASSIPATLRHYYNLRRQVQQLDEDDCDDGSEDAAVITPLVQIPGFFDLIDELRSLTVGKPDSKLFALRELLAGTADRKVVVFSSSRRSLLYLEEQLMIAGIECVRIDGLVPYNPGNPAEDERQLRIGRFRDPAGPRVLLSSEVGSEGLDFQFCDTLVNWDLPWNPMVVEQRIGRLDRLGQKSERIVIRNFSTAGTIEDRVLRRLYDRVGLFEGAIGPLEPILGDVIQELTSELLRPHLTAEEIDEIVEKRALALEQKLQTEMQFEQNAEALLGHDEVIRDRIEKVRKLGRYVTPAELHLFVQDFLRHNYPAAALRDRYDGTQTRDAGEHCFWMTVNQPLRELVRYSGGSADDPELVRFLTRPIDRDLRVTFHSKAAMTDRSVELIHNQHPLVKSIVKTLERTPEKLLSVGRAILRTHLVPEGDYAFYWAEVSETGLQAGKAIWCEVAEHDGTNRIEDHELAEQLIYEVLVHGEGWREGFEAPNATSAMRVKIMLQDWVIERCDRRRAVASEQNNSRVEARLAAMEATTAARRRVVEGQLQHHRERGNHRIIPAVQGQLQRIENDFVLRRGQLNEGRDVSVGYSDGGFGYIRVFRT